MKKASPYSHLKIFRHTKLLEKLLAGERVAPVYIRIKPTNICNQNCYYCHYKSPYLTLDNYQGGDMIPREKMLEIIADMKEMGVKAVTFSGGGEPLCYPHIEETMQAVLDAGIDLSIITNGTLLDGRRAELLAQAKWVRISCESAYADKYAQIRGVRPAMFEKLKENIAHFSKIKNTNTELGVNVVVGKDNHADVYAFAELMKGLGVNHIKYAPLMSNDTEEYHAPFKEQVFADLARAKELETDRFRIIDLYTSDFERIAATGGKMFDRAYENCWMKEFICVIAADAKVYFCHDKAYLSNGVVGDLAGASFKDVWFSDEVTEMFRNFSAPKRCREHCAYDDRNILLNQYFSMDENHVNFL